MAQAVIDNTAAHRYESVVDGLTAFVTYERAPGQITLIHTEVPASISGHGVASTLTRTVLDMARANGDKVVAKCAFISAFVRRHPEYQDLLVTALS